MSADKRKQNQNIIKFIEYYKNSNKGEVYSGKILYLKRKKFLK